MEALTDETERYRLQAENHDLQMAIAMPKVFTVCNALRLDRWKNR